MNRIHGLGPGSTRILKQLASIGKSIFTRKEVARYWDGGPEGLNNFLYRLAKHGWIKRLERGKYMILPFEAGPTGEFAEHEFIIAARLVSPYMIALWSAMNHHGLTEQIPDRIYLLSPKTKHCYQGVMAGVSYRILTVPRAKFFGATFAWIGQEKIWITDMERTLLDAVLWPQHCGGFTEVAKAFREAGDRPDLGKLADYARKMGRGVAFKRLGIIGEWLGWPKEVLTKWQTFTSKGISLLDPQGSKSGPQISRWNIRLNATLENLND